MTGAGETGAGETGTGATSAVFAAGAWVKTGAAWAVVIGDKTQIPHRSMAAKRIAIDNGIHS